MPDRAFRPERSGAPLKLARLQRHALKRQPWANRSADKCGDGCLDKLVVSVRRAKQVELPVKGGLLDLPRTSEVGVPPVSGGTGVARLLLLGLLSGSPVRRDMLRCSWMAMPALEQHVRLLFVVGRAGAEHRADVLPVNVTEGEHMRRAGQNHTRTFDAKKGIRTGTVTTYWKLAAFLEYAARQPEPMIGRADDDVFISPRMLIAHATLILRHAAETSAPYAFGGVFEW